MLLNNLDLDNTPELSAVEGDRQYTIRIVRLARRFQKEENGGKPFLTATLTIPDEPASNDFDEFIAFLPDPNDTSKDAVRAKNRIRAFLKAFNLSPAIEFTENEDNAVAPDAVGAECIAVLSKKQDKRDGTWINGIKQYL